MQIDLAELPQGQTYEDRYGGYIEVFRKIAMTPGDEQVIVHNPPWSWCPLLYHLRCTIITPREVFPHCKIVKRSLIDLDRTAVEVLCCFRPETVDCLWKCDVQWNVPEGRVRAYHEEKEFIVTNNGSYHRPEVLNYLKALDNYKPTKRKVLLVPCAADKPYPSKLHQACLDILPDDFYLMNATGVVGLVPQDLWPVMPWYDSGIPNQWRLFKIVQKYFGRFDHDKVVVYCDFYSETIYDAFDAIRVLDRAVFVNEVKEYHDYIDLLDPDRLEKLKAALSSE